jgi:DNA invertase Pin-like site-specific DNA recombinase
MAKKAVTRAPRAATNGKPHTKAKAKPQLVAEEDNKASGVKTRFVLPTHDGPLQPQVYSYGRFSRDSQKTGDSERRQTDRWEEARKYADKMGLPFNESLRMFDRGRSAWNKDHITKGVFGQFLGCVEKGQIAVGSVLVVEEIDRVSRLEPIDGLAEVIIPLVKAGITIYTPTDDIAYTREALGRGLLQKLIGKLELAHEESQKKSTRLKAAWEQKRKNARNNLDQVTNMAPSWLEYENQQPGREDEPRKLILKNGKPIANKAAAKMIRGWFENKAKGLKNIASVRESNKLGTWSPGHGISTSFVMKILTDRRVLGERQFYKKVNGKDVPDGEPVRGFWPQIVDEGLFNRVQQIIKQRRGRNMGRSGAFLNVLHNLCKCPYCDGSIHIHPVAGGYDYLVCSSRRGGPVECRKPAPAMKYAEVVQAVLQHCRRLRPEQVLPNKDEKQEHVEKLRDKIADITATINAKKEEDDNYFKQIGRTRDPKSRDEYEAERIKLRSQQLELKSELDKLRDELEDAQRDKKTFTAWQANITTLATALENKDDVELRERLNGRLHDLIEKIELFSHGYKDADADDFDSYLHESQAEPWVGNETDGNAEYQLEFRSERMRTEFVKWAMAKRHTKAGRFIRIHYRYSPAKIKHLQYLLGKDTALYFDIVPEGSIAGETSIGSLLEQFSKTRKIPACANFVKVTHIRTGLGTKARK